MFLIESIQHENFTEILEFYRDESGKKHIKHITDFKPYFFIPEKDIIPDDYRIIGIETGYKSILDEPVKKIFVKRSKDVVGVRNLFNKHYEADINFSQRYIIDKIGEAPIYKLKTLSLDIETDTENTFPNIDNPDQKITSCAFCDNDYKRKCFVLKNNNTTEQLLNEKDVEICETEIDLLESIMAYIHIEDPDIITGWAVIDFDLAYLINRMKKIGIDYNNMSPIKQVFCNKNKFNKDNYDVTIRGRIVLDSLRLYKHFRRISNQGMMESYSLDFTAQDLLGTGKIKHKETFHNMWFNNPKKLAKYNIKDAELVIKILEKLDLINFFNFIRSKNMAQMSQIYQALSLVDGVFLRYLHNKLVLPSKIKKDADKYDGAYVFPPKPGLYDNIFVLDLKALYPNIIKTFDIGIDTFNPNGEIKLKEGIGFNKGIGIISKIIRNLEKDRDTYKKRMWEADKNGNKELYTLNYYNQYAIKTILNSIYGYFGCPSSRLYKKEIAEAVTEWGQKIIKWSWKVLENLGYEVTYCDTDSLFVKAKEITLFKLLIEGKKLSEEINKSYISFCKDYGSDDCTLEMEFEKIFKRLLFVGKKGKEEKGAKKKYAYRLLWQDKKKVNNDIIFVGFSNVRSDSSRVSKKLQLDIVTKIFDNVKKEEIIEDLRKIDKQIRNKEIPIEEIAFPKGISGNLSDYGKNIINETTKKIVGKKGTPPVIVGAKYVNKYLGKRFSQGSKPKWVYIKKVPRGYPDTHVITFEDDDFPEGFEIDYDKMIDKIIISKIEKIFSASGFGKIPNINSEQKTLF